MGKKVIQDILKKLEHNLEKGETFLLQIPKKDQSYIRQLLCNYSTVPISVILKEDGILLSKTTE